MLCHQPTADGSFSGLRAERLNASVHHLWKTNQTDMSINKRTSKQERMSKYKYIQSKQHDNKKVTIEMVATFLIVFNNQSQTSVELNEMIK